ncbi:MAG: hypothetical protein C4522_18495 [Desulfobacteraceae bacterium]|nr:MAG: hypothetical protein C4522_18495 [Desulfobacteraceae bacterium]
MKKYLHPFLKFLLIGLVAIKITASILILTGWESLSHLFHVPQLAHAQNEKPEAPKQPEGKTVEETPTAVEPENKDTAVIETKIILESMEKKRLFLQQEEIRIEEERKQLEALKEEMEEKVQTLNNIHKQIEEKMIRIEKKETAQEIQAKEAKEQKIKQLLKIYSGMKPKDVGSIIDKLEFQDALTIFLRMKGDQASKILTFVNQERAVKISQQLINANQQKIAE